MIEERIEEQRLMRQFEEEQHRLEHEQHVIRTKAENERKKEEAMRRAIEKAAMEAKMEKDRRKGRLSSSQSFDFGDLSESQKSSPEPEAVVQEMSDGEKVLIGTPIKLKKKDLKVKKSPTLSDQTEESEEDSSVASQKKVAVQHIVPKDDGLTLPVQSLIPIMPVQFANFGFAPGNNLQLVMVAQSPAFAMYQNFQNFGVANANSPIVQKIEQPKPEVEVKVDEKRPDTTSTSELCAHCNEYHFCGKLKKEEEIEKEDEAPPSIPHEGTFTKEILPDNTKLDASTSTSEEFSTLIRHTPSPAAKISNALVQWSDIGIQTDFECDQCHSSTSTRKERQRYLIERTRSEEETTTTTTTTTIVKKSEKKFDTMQDRPKWGVRIPTVQYLKASERDPFRNRRRRFTKKVEAKHHLMDESSSSEAAQSRSPPPTRHKTTSSAATVGFSRNICTELLPIKTDGNGKVYFVREKSFVINEALRADGNGFAGIVQHGKILNKRMNSEDNKLAGVSTTTNNDFDSIETSRHSSIDYTN